MNRTTSRFLQCLIVLGLAAYLADKWISGKLAFYISSRFFPLTLISLAALGGMAGVGLWRFFRSRAPLEKQPGLERSTISPATILILLVPLLLGVFVPARPLTAASVSNRGMSVSAPVSLGSQTNKTLDVAPDDRTVLDWIKVFNYEKDLARYIGQQANVIGFVYHDTRLNRQQFMVGRFAITCCVADAFAIGMAVDWQDSIKLADNTWVAVKGPVDELTLDDQKVPLIHAQSVTPVDAPEEPYLYP
ncbi:MAG TPA: TIGR03943 family protein [Anaerolineaceae bacterium]|nr:TIGR03943 family protein [Anaerolineaceae bacterium]